MPHFYSAPVISLLARPQFAEPSHLPVHWLGESTDGERLAEFAGRLCYMSQKNPANRGTREYLENIKKQGHGSVLEHANYSVLIEGISRSLTHELVDTAKTLEAAKRVAQQIDDSMRAGKPVDDAMKDAVAPYVRPEKVETLKVLPAPAGAAADGGADGGEASTPKQPLAAATFDAGTDNDRPQTQTSNNFNRGGDPFPGLTPDGTITLMRFAFSGKDGDVMDVPLRTPEGFNVIVLKQHTQATRADFEKDRESFEQELLRGKRDEALSLYVKRLRDQAKDDIKIDESYIEESKVDGGSAPEDEDEY